MGGVQLMVIGIPGEYVGRTFMEAKGRPVFLIREVRRSPSGRTAAPAVGVAAQAGATAPEARAGAAARATR